MKLHNRNIYLLMVLEIMMVLNILQKIKIKYLNEKENNKVKFLDFINYSYPECGKYLINLLIIYQKI